MIRYYSTNSNKDLNFYKELCEIQSIGFMSLSETQTRSLLSKDLDIDSGLKYMSSYLPKIKIDTELDLKEDLKLSGSESIIFQNRKQIYTKLNFPSLKVNTNRFNDYILSIILQEFLFPDYKYYNFRISEYNSEKGFLMDQKMSTGNNVSFNKIIQVMQNYGWTYYKNEKFIYRFSDEAVIVVSDLNTKNCRLKGDILECFDPKIQVLYIN